MIAYTALNFFGPERLFKSYDVAKMYADDIGSPVIEIEMTCKEYLKAEFYD